MENINLSMIIYFQGTLSEMSLRKVCSFPQSISPSKATHFHIFSGVFQQFNSLLIQQRFAQCGRREPEATEKGTQNTYGNAMVERTDFHNALNRFRKHSTPHLHYIAIHATKLYHSGKVSGEHVYTQCSLAIDIPMYLHLQSDCCKFRGMQKFDTVPGFSRSY